MPVNAISMSRSCCISESRKDTNLQGNIYTYSKVPYAIPIISPVTLRNRYIFGIFLVYLPYISVKIIRIRMQFLKWCTSPFSRQKLEELKSSMRFLNKKSRGRERFDKWSYLPQDTNRFPQQRGHSPCTLNGCAKLPTA